MEAYFRKDQEIQELVDVFIEKLFTVNILSGSDADSEFYRGRQAVEKIASFFQEMADLEEEALMDGIRQLVEQRLPDSRVIENFPNFYDLMNEMILAALPRTEAVPTMISIPKPETSQVSINHSPLGGTTLTPSSKIVLNGGRTTNSFSQDQDIPIPINHHIYRQTSDSLKYNSELQAESDSSLKITNELISNSTPDIINQYNNSKTSVSTTVSNAITYHIEKNEAFILNEIADISTDSVIDIANMQNPQSFEASDISAYTDMFSESQAFDTLNPAEASPQKPLEIPYPIPKVKSKLDQSKSPFKFGSLIKYALNSASIDLESAIIMKRENLSTEVSDSESPIEHNNTSDQTKLGTSEEFVMVTPNQMSEKSKKVEDIISNPPLRRDPFRFNPKKLNSELRTHTIVPITQQSKPIVNPFVSETNLVPLKNNNHNNNLDKPPITKSRVVRSAQMPEGGERLAMVLNKIFPDFSIRWNVVIGKNTFYAQIDNVLVYVLEPSRESDIKNIEHIKFSLKKEEWSVYICREEDLAYPRRLERGIRLIMR